MKTIDKQLNQNPKERTDSGSSAAESHMFVSRSAVASLTETNDTDIVYVVPNRRDKDGRKPESTEKNHLQQAIVITKVAVRVIAPFQEDSPSWNQ